MTWATLSHAEMADRLRALLAADPPKPPRILFAAPDGRHQIPRPAVGGDTGCAAVAAAGKPRRPGV